MAEHKGCEHTNVSVDFDITNIADKDVWMADICVTCDDCGARFKFQGVPRGDAVCYVHPTASAAGYQIRLPVLPVAVN